MSDEVIDETTLLSDDLMPSDSSVFLPEEAEAQVQAVNEERAMVQGARPLFDTLLAWFDSEIVQADSIDNIYDPSRVGGELSAAEQVKAMKEVKHRLKTAKERLVVLKREYLDD